jgi:uncharacterized protein YaaR (DUF327 family)
MRIENRPVSTKEQLAKDKVLGRKGRKTFLETLQTMDTPEEAAIDFDLDDVNEDDLKSLGERIISLGGDLSNHPDPEAFVKYKNHIRLFLKILQGNYEVNVIRVRTRKSKFEDKVLVEQIDAGLRQIAELILSGEKDRISYLKLTNSIRGLIVDLIL